MISDSQKNLLLAILKDSFTNVTESGGGRGYRFHHAVQVASYAEKIVRTEKISLNEENLYIAALFHDIGKLRAVDCVGRVDYDSDGNKNHDIINGDDLYKVIGSVVSDKNKLHDIAGIIRNRHNFDTELESKVLVDADELAEFGYLHVWRSFVYACEKNMDIVAATDYWFREGRLEIEKLFEKLNFESTKIIAKQRFDNQNTFYKTLQDEYVGKDFDTLF